MSTQPISKINDRTFGTLLRQRDGAVATRPVAVPALDPYQGITAAVTELLAVTGLAEHRAIIDGVTGLAWLKAKEAEGKAKEAEGKVTTTVTTFYGALTRHVQSQKPDMTDATAKTWAYRVLADLGAAQKATGYHAIEWETGEVLDNKRGATTFKLPVVEVALDVYQEAQQDPDWHSKCPTYALRKAARHHAHRLRGTGTGKTEPLNSPKPHRGPKTSAELCRSGVSNLKTGRTRVHKTERATYWDRTVMFTNLIPEMLSDGVDLKALALNILRYDAELVPEHQRPAYWGDVINTALAEHGAVETEPESVDRNVYGQGEYWTDPEPESVDKNVYGPLSTCISIVDRAPIELRFDLIEAAPDSHTPSLLGGLVATATPGNGAHPALVPGGVAVGPALMSERVADALALCDLLGAAGVGTVLPMMFDDASGRPVDDAYEKLEVFKAALPGYLDVADTYQLSLIVRLYGGDCDAPPGLLMADDCTQAELDRYSPFAFFTVETSPGNSQAWLLVDGVDAPGAAIVRERFFDRARAEGERANRGSSGALRFPGSRNFKPCHAPLFPTVKLIAATGRTVTPSELEASGLLAPERIARGVGCLPSPDNEPTAFPDYDACLAVVRTNAKGTGPDRSDADLEWCRRAFELGHRSRATMARELARVSDKAREHRNAYRYAVDKVNASARHWHRLDTLTA